MTGYSACTIVARNYSAQARVLARCFSAAHPHIPFFTLVIDGDDEDRSLEGIGTVVIPVDLNLDPVVLHRMIAMYDVMEFATALKPAMLMHLVRSGADAAAYFDPDIRVYDELTDVFETAEREGIFLTPHTLQPIPRDGRSLNEQQIMHAGIYNLGFICVGASAYRFLSWWHQRLEVDAVVDLEHALFTDQRWIDWVPALFPHAISRDQGLNAAYWNLHEREIRRVGDRYFAGADPLRFFHFSGYDPARPWLLSTHMGDQPRILLSEHRELQALADSYGAELVEFHHPELRKTPYGLTELPNGVRLAKALRRFYRLVVKGKVSVPVSPPDPITAPDSFVDWFHEPTLGSSAQRFSPAEYALWWERGDVRMVIHDPIGDGGAAFRTWLTDDPWVGEQLESLGAPDRDGVGPDSSPSAVHVSARRAFGWSVLAYATSEHGVGEAGRRMSSLMNRLGMPVETVGIREGPLSRQQHRSERPLVDTVGYENAVVCVNADQTPRVSRMLDLSAIRGRKAGLWFWELDSFPPEHLRSLAYLSEVWVTSSFTYEALRRDADRPVHLVHLPIVPTSEPTRFTRRSLRMPDDTFVFLTNFDFLSVLQRKNPIGVIHAYRDAFGPQDGAVLIVKSINGHLRPLDFERMYREAQDRPDILFEDAYVTSAGMKAMIELADCYVSLHRSEGYGLNMADAMAHGTPVIATAYSGNLDFMTTQTAELIPFELTEVGPLAAPYDPAARWAEPDLDRASEAMRRLFDDRAVGDRLSRAATAHLLDHFSPAAMAAELRAIVLPVLGVQELQGQP